MSQAPSEKHLEDWIVDNPDELFVTSIGERIVNRQVRLPSGVCDLITLKRINYGALGIRVFELKKETIDSEAVTQCLRYMRDIRQVFNYTAHTLGKRDNFVYEDVPPVMGTLIGHSVKNKKLLTVCAMCNIQVMLYSYENNESDDYYEFYEQDDEFWDSSIATQVAADYAKGFLGDIAREIIADRNNINYVKG